MDLLTPSEVAVLLRVRVSTLRAWRSRGKGPSYVKIGGRVLYRRSAVEQYVASRDVEVAS